jgi:hypothetical protein
MMKSAERSEERVVSERLDILKRSDIERERRISRTKEDNARREMEVCTFKPHISQKSKTIAENLPAVSDTLIIFTL